MTIESMFDHPSSGITQPEPKKDAPPPADEAAKIAAAEEAKAATLFDSMRKDEPVEKKDDKPAEKTDEDRAAALYDAESTYADSVLLTEVPASATPEQIAAANSDVRKQYAAMELPGTLARTLTDRVVAAMRAPISDAEYDNKVATFKSELGRRWGGIEHVEERLNDVRALLARADPAVLKVFVESGLNVDPETIAALADHARSLRGRGRLK
jgi:hypothetical protein